ncbi:WGR domain-containing protein [Shinella kummerowiae]|jgi:predicted DNA-binding WGR domain protein|uniref:WGR domain-containing protein n=1 Tax=Shinella kummerowiae TaxID=417745 RepID=A0A6N8SPP2_9HYPH|nr:WGR domain-containing protein [Shinella kummerowiae]MXN48972.1 WGR domain-containing protein [Shinella kummerowiae]
MQSGPSIHFERRDPARNMKRFYRLTVQQDLFGTVLLVREWGRIGVSSHQQTQEAPDLAAASLHAQRLAGEKQRRGYVPVAR